MFIILLFDNLLYITDIIIDKSSNSLLVKFNVPSSFLFKIIFNVLRTNFLFFPFFIFSDIAMLILKTSFKEFSGRIISNNLFISFPILSSETKESVVNKFKVSFF